MLAIGSINPCRTTPQGAVLAVYVKLSGMSSTHAAETGKQPSADPQQALSPLDRMALLIPAWKPTQTLPQLIADLESRGFGTILIVDDGSPEACRAIFAEAAVSTRVQVLRHELNLGKGRALKSGLQHLLTTRPGLTGVVTADADGQHLPEDIERVARELLEGGTRPVLGVRVFDGSVPLRSRLGNILTRRMFAFLTGVTLRDTQTGLRGLPIGLLSPLVGLEGERYEYEMTMLAHLCRTGHPPLELPIATVYTERNRGSHFNPVWDSLRIYRVLLRFYVFSVLVPGIGANTL